MIITLWILTVLFTLSGTWLALKKPKAFDSKSTIGEKPGVTVLKPLCGNDPGLRENLESFFRLDYPEFELIFSVNDPKDPAVALVKELQSKYPKIASWLVLGGVNAGLNPKVNNLVRSYELATHDLILISDSNVRVHESYLSRMLPQLKEGVGVVTAVVAGTSPSGFGGYLEATYLNTFYARGMKLAFATGNPCVIGKSMLFRKSIAASFGGIQALSGYLAEDYALGEEMRKLGLRVELADEPITQFIGTYSFRSFWDRHIRWGRIRKAHAPLAFLAEPLVSPLLSSVVAGFAFLGTFSFFYSFILNLLVCMICDLLLVRRYSRKISLLTPALWFAREALSLPLWLSVASGNTVNWRGKTLTLRYGGLISVAENKEQECLSFGERLPLHTRWRATTRPATGGVGSQTAI